MECDSPEAIQAFLAVAMKLRPLEERRITLKEFKPRSDDVIIATTSKSGTTMMQQIVHGLRTGGSMDFEEISVVIPHLEHAKGIGIDLDAEQVAKPRAFKTHECYNFCPKGAGRHIVVIRHPLDIAPSLYSFLNGWVFASGTISPDTFIRMSILSRTNPPECLDDKSNDFHFIESWWKHRNDENVLFFFYEDIIENFAETVREVAHFIGCGEDEKIIELATKQASKEFMLEHVSHFDEHVFKKIRNKVCGLPEDRGMGKENSKVRRQGDGIRRRDLSPEIVKEINLAWKRMEELTGCASYDELRAKYGRKSRETE